MARALLLHVGQRGQPGMDRAPLRRRRALLHDRRDQRVAEAKPVAVADHNVGGERLLEAGLRLDRFKRGLRQRGDHPQQRARVGRERREASCEQPADVGRRLGSGRADELQRHQRVPGRGVMEPRKGGRGHRLTGPGVHEPAQLPSVERLRRQLHRVAGWEPAHERGERLVSLAATDRRDDLRPGLEAPQREAQHGRAGGVEPLPVVDREDDGAGQPGEQGQAREAHLPRLDRLRAVLQQQRRRQRATLRRGESRQLLEHRPEQVVQGRVGAAGLCRARPRPEHERPGSDRLAHDGLEQRRLTHTGLALDERDVWPSRAPHDLPQLLELGLAPDDRVRHRHAGDRRASVRPLSRVQQSANATMSGIWPERQPYQGPTPVLDEVRVRKSRPES